MLDDKYEGHSNMIRFLLSKTKEGGTTPWVRIFSGRGGIHCHGENIHEFGEANIDYFIRNLHDALSRNKSSCVKEAVQYFKQSTIKFIRIVV